MLNIYDYIEDSRLFKKLEVDDLLFVEYKCLIEETKTGYWCHNNYFVYVVGGTKKWITGEKEYLVKDNEAIFIKKGAYIAKQYSDDDFCALLIFVPDSFIETILNKYASEIFWSNKKFLDSDAILPLELDDALSGYFLSMMGYFLKSIPPPKSLLKIKFEELILNILSNPKHQALASYFKNVHENTKVSIPNIMESYFTFAMDLNEYAKLCARSLSVFKADFYTIYGCTPGKWLISKRLGYAKILIENTEKSINDIAFESGFKSTSHFVRIFKKIYGNPPLQHRLIKN